MAERMGDGYGPAIREVDVEDCGVEPLAASRSARILDARHRTDDLAPQDRIRTVSASAAMDSASTIRRRRPVSSRTRVVNMVFPARARSMTAGCERPSGKHRGADPADLSDGL